MPIPIPIPHEHPTKYITPPTPCSSPEPRGPPSCQAGLDDFGYPINVQYKRPGCSTANQRNEFPFPIQPLPKQLRTVLDQTIPEEPAEFDLEIPSSKDGPERPPIHPLPTPPRSHPSIPTIFSYSPPSSSYGPQTPSPTPISTGLSSKFPSLSTSSRRPSSPSSPITPTTPLSRFNSAASALKLVLMANDVGMSLQELEELNEFAEAPSTSGDTCSKRAGRVLMRKDVQQRRERQQKKSGDSYMTSQDPFHKREDCKTETCGRHTAPASKWRDIQWSRFSDSTDEDVVMPGIDANSDCDGDEEMTALDGYLKMAEDADKAGRRSSSIMNVSAVLNKTVLGTAEIGRRVRPTKLCMRSSIETVEAAIGPMGERIWS